MAEIDRIISGETKINDYNIDIEFNPEELAELIDAGIIRATDLCQSVASDMIIDEVINYEQYPFENFSPCEQIRQLQRCAIEPWDFRKKADLASFGADDWLFLLEVLASFVNDNVPWDKLRQEGSVKSWFDLLTRRPEFAVFADWQILAEKGSAGEFLELLRHEVSLFAHFVHKEQLLQADSRLWVELLAVRPEFADIYPVETLDEVDEVEFLLLHQPQLVSRITWDADNPPVKLFIVNPEPEIEDNEWARDFLGAANTDQLQPILENVLNFQPSDARRWTVRINYDRETFAGIYSSRTAEHIMQEFSKAVTESRLELKICKKEVDYGN